jgi:hypothetical protein
MRVDEAVEEIMSLVASGESLSSVRTRIRQILDAVWLTAYEEGESKVFSS